MSVEGQARERNHQDEGDMGAHAGLGGIGLPNAPYQSGHQYDNI